LTFSPAPRWLLWLLPVLVAMPWAVGYVRERDEINTQPGLLLVGSVLSVLVVWAALLGAAEIRRRRLNERLELAERP